MNAGARLLGGRYQVGELIGYGGTAEVHRGRDLRLGRDVALKMLRTDLAGDATFQMRFRREAQNASSLNHPAIVAVYDTGEERTATGETLPYIVMEFVPGGTLKEALAARGRFQPREALEIMADVCTALDFSHRHGIVHRDVKPGNVMVTPSSQVKVMDFGIARALATGATTITQTAAVIGTAQYMSPEQARGEAMDARSDVYGAGCVLYELLCGHPPFVGDSPVAVAYQHVREDPRPPSALVEGIGVDVDAVVLMALRKHPASRYQSAGAMRDDLLRAAAGRPLGATPVLGSPPAEARTAPTEEPARRRGLRDLLGLGRTSAEGNLPTGSATVNPPTPAAGTAPAPQPSVAPATRPAGRVYQSGVQEQPAAPAAPPPGPVVAERRAKAAGGVAAEGLDLSDLGLTALPDWLRDFTRLTWLNLSGNRIGQLPAWLGELTALRQLDLARNRLIEVPESLSRLVDLRQLYLGGNRLISLPEPLGDLPALHTLVLDQNPLTSPPPEVVAAGTPSVLAFLRASGSASVPQWASKLMVVGEGRVGKTSLVKALSGRKHDPAEPTTHGLFVDGLSLAHPELAGTRMTLSVWDFGGQDIYHATHQFFLTDRSVFLLVWNSGEGTQRGRLQYWLDIITARAPQAPILLAATHAADRPVDIDLATLKAAYPAIVGSFPVDCAARTGFEQLHVALVGAAAGLPLMGAEWPRAWAAAAEALTGRDSEPYLSAARMFQVMDQAGVGDPAEQQTLATALAHRGQILFYPDDEELSDTVILDPQWLSTRISQVLDSPAVAAHNGLLTGTELGGIWPGMPRAQRLFLLALMEKFDICYRVRESTDDALAIVIAWLPQTPSDYGAEWRETRSGHREIRVEYQLPILPPGIPGWFLARSHRFGTPHRWRSGAVLRHPDGVHTGLLRTDPGRNRVELTVRGPMPGGFFALLDDGLNLTMDRYPGLRITRWVPCQGHGPCEKLFDYSKLIARLQREQTTAYCDEADEHVDIAALLYGIAPPVRAFATGDLRHLIASGFNALRQEIAGYNHDNQREYLRLRTLVQKAQQTHCPSVFTIVPDGRKRVGKTLHTLRLYCEEPDSWHPLPGADGCYEVAELSDWLRTVGPHLARTLQLLRATVPFVGPLLGLTAHELQEQLTDELDLTRQVLDTIGASSADPPLAPGRPDARPLSHADTDADFRTLKNLLLRLDPEQRWGGLSHVLTPEGMSLYLCSEHVAAYRPAVVP